MVGKLQPAACDRTTEFDTELTLEDGLLNNICSGLLDNESDDDSEYEECSIHGKRRRVKYMVQRSSGVWECQHDSVCKQARATSKEENQKRKARKWACETCHMTLNSERQASIHFGSQKHNAKVKELQGEYSRRGLVYEPPAARMVTEEDEEVASVSNSSHSSRSNSTAASDAGAPAGMQQVQLHCVRQPQPPQAFISAVRNPQAVLRPVVPVTSLVPPIMHIVQAPAAPAPAPAPVPVSAFRCAYIPQQPQQQVVWLVQMQ